MKLLETLGCLKYICRYKKLFFHCEITYMFVTIKIDLKDYAASYSVIGMNSACCTCLK